MPHAAGSSASLSSSRGDIDRLVDAIAKSHGDPAVLGPRSTALYEERKRIRAELDAAPPPTEVIALHPAVLARYEEQLTSLQEALDRGARAGDSECAEAIRDLVEPLLSSVTHPDQVESKLKSSAVSLHSWARRPIQMASEECGERW